MSLLHLGPFQMLVPCVLILPLSPLQHVSATLSIYPNTRVELEMEGFQDFLIQPLYSFF